MHGVMDMATLSLYGMMEMTIFHQRIGNMASIYQYGIVGVTLSLYRMIKMTLLLHEYPRVLTDIPVSLKPLASRAVVVAVTSNLPNISDLTLAMDPGPESQLTYSRTPTLS